MRSGASTVCMQEAAGFSMILSTPFPPRARRTLCYHAYCLVPKHGFWIPLYCRSWSWTCQCIPSPLTTLPSWLGSAVAVLNTRHLDATFAQRICTCVYKRPDGSWSEPPGWSQTSSRARTKAAIGWVCRCPSPRRGPAPIMIHPGGNPRWGPAPIMIHAGITRAYDHAPTRCR